MDYTSNDDVEQSFKDLACTIVKYKKSRAEDTIEATGKRDPYGNIVEDMKIILEALERFL